jgi:hypothetical protein
MTAAAVLASVKDKPSAALKNRQRHGIADGGGPLNIVVTLERHGNGHQFVPTP